MVNQEFALQGLGPGAGLSGLLWRWGKEERFQHRLEFLNGIFMVI